MPNEVNVLIILHLFTAEFRWLEGYLEQQGYHVLFYRTIAEFAAQRRRRVEMIISDIVGAERFVLFGLAKELGVTKLLLLGAEHIDQRIVDSLQAQVLQRIPRKSVINNMHLIFHALKELYPESTKHGKEKER